MEPAEREYCAIPEFFGTEYAFEETHDTAQSLLTVNDDEGLIVGIDEEKHCGNWQAEQERLDQSSGLPQGPDESTLEPRDRDLPAPVLLNETLEGKVRRVRDNLVSRRGAVEIVFV